ncbi:hypothetical protein GYMLUDRAFT_242309 [Collybiopsis luxurians FD-317 M1]|uniref:Uncharacterized protein n=1 Tax=Collybiopsis luxurians FD-317 M1 TaxID=944289 RepID=A0A0D0D0U9_9AGAR|nr:hypothetical protein GYMLUDRAFT_242309 [Collybiopsis luxurians FD-317 M1]
MKRSHSLLESEADQRYMKVQVVSREFSESQEIIAQLEKEIEVLQKEAKRRDTVRKKAEMELDRKQRELDESIEEILNWVPKAIVDTQNKHNSTYRALRQTSLQLMECQSKLNIPVSLSLVDESDLIEDDPNPPRMVDAEATDISLLLGCEWLKSKDTHKREISALEKKVTSLENQLANLEAKHARLEAEHASCDKRFQKPGKQGNRGELAEVSVELPQTGNAGPQAEKEESLSDDSNLVCYCGFLS